MLSIKPPVLPESPPLNSFLFQLSNKVQQLDLKLTRLQIGDLSNVSTTAPVTNQLLQWNGSSWTPTTVNISNATGDITGVDAGAGLTGGGQTGTVSLNVGAGNGITVNSASIEINTNVVVTKTNTQTLTNKTLTSPVINTSISGSVIDTDLSSNVSSNDDTLASAKAIKTYVDANIMTANSTVTFTNKTINADNNTLSNIEVDNFKSGVLDTNISTNVSSNDDTLASAKAIKTYVDAQVSGTGVGDITNVIAGDGLTGGGTAGAITVNVVGGTGITANANDIAIDNTVATLDGTQTLTNKTITNGTFNGNIIAEDGYIGAGDASADNWVKFHYVSGNPSGFSAQYSNAAAISNEQGTANQHLYLLDTTANNTGELFGLASNTDPIFSITGQGHIIFKRPQNNTSYDITLACPTPTASRTATLPDATGTIITTGNLSGITSVGTLSTLTVGDMTLTGSTISDAGDFTLDIDGNITLDANGGTFSFQDNGLDFFNIKEYFGNVILKPNQANKSLIFQRTNGDEVARVSNSQFFDIGPNRLAIDGTQVTATGAEFNYLDITTLGTVEASKAVTADANGDVLFSDNDKAKFGNSDDLQIYHETTYNNSIIQESGSGNLLIGGSQINFRESTLTTTLANFSTAVDLYYNGSKKFATDTSGVAVTGRLTTSSHIDISNPNGYGRIEIGGDSGAFIDLKSPFSDDFDSRLITAGTDHRTLQIQSDDLHLKSRLGNADYLDATVNGAVNLYYNNEKVFETASTGVTIEDPSNSSASKSLRIIGKRSDSNDSYAFSGKLMLATNRTDQLLDTGKTIGIIGFGGNHTDGTVGNILYSSAITGVSEGDFNSATDMPTGLAFFTGSTGRDPDTPNVTINTERMRINKDGYVGIGKTNPGVPLDVAGQIRTTDSSLDLRMLPIDASNAGIVGTFSNDDLVLYANSAEVVRVKTNGDVDIRSSADNGPVLNLISNDHGDAGNFDQEGAIQFYADNSANESTLGFKIYHATGAITDGSEAGWLYLNNTISGTNQGVAAFGNGNFFLLDDDAIIQWNLTRNTSYDINLQTTTPTADRTITLPNANGYVQLNQGYGESNGTFQNFQQDYQSSSYFVAGEYIEIATITPSGNSRNYSFTGTMMAQVSNVVQVLDVNVGIRYNSSGSMGYGIAYSSHQLSSDDYIEPVLWVNTSTNTIKLLIQGKTGSIHKVNVNLCFVQRGGYNDTTWNTTVLQDTTSVPSGYTEYIGEKVFSSQLNGAVELYYNNIKQFETTSTGASIRADEDDVGLVVGKAHIGHVVHNDYGAFSHYDMRNSTGGYALLQSSNGQTLLNAASGQVLQFRRNNSAIGTFETDGTLTVGTGTVITTTNSDTPTTTTSSSDADFVLIDDGGTMKKITPSNLGIGSGGGGSSSTLTNGGVTKAQATSDGLQILDNGAGSLAVLELGTGSTTEQGFIRLHGSTANKSSSIYTSNGNLHIDSASGGHGIYLNWYTSDGGSSTNGTYFGNGNSSQVGRIDSSGNLYLSGDIDLGDSKFITFGANNNLTIGYNGNNSVIYDNAAGSLSLQSNGTEINLWDRANSQYMARFITGDRSELQFNGSTKLATTNTGVTVTGLLSATTKSFDIEHPTKSNMRLRYGSLEGPENGVYVRGRLKGRHVINLPDYWTGLVHEDSITVNLTPIGNHQGLYVESIENNMVFVSGESNSRIDCFYTVYGERKDVERFEVEYEN